MKTTTYHIKKTFTKGTLEGMTFWDYDAVSYPAGTDFQAHHVDGVNKNHSKGRVDYKIVEWMVGNHKTI